MFPIYIAFLSLSISTIILTTPPPVIAYTAPESLDERIMRVGGLYGFTDLSVAKAIMYCESRNNQEARGTLAKVGTDIGIFQINNYYHEESAKKLGLDIYQLEDNLKYGFMLLEQEGTRPWKSSKHCHGY